MKSKTFYNPSLCEVTLLLRKAFADGHDVQVTITIDDHADELKTVYDSEAQSRAAQSSPC